ncbi:MAG: hypothetical protein Q9220_005068 [cf. Caloplaca sp. 1 TL-2023]
MVRPSPSMSLYRPFTLQICDILSKSLRLDNPIRFMPKPSPFRLWDIRSDVHVSIRARWAQLKIARVHQSIAHRSVPRGDFGDGPGFMVEVMASGFPRVFPPDGPS